MTVVDDEFADEDFARLLENVDDGLAAGNQIDTRELVDDLPLRTRLNEAKECLELLHAVWPVHEAVVPTSEMTSATDNVTVQRIGRFEVERELGRGGHGVVLLAFDPLLRRRVALKVPRPENLVSDGMRERFQREALLAARLDHPNLVALYEVGCDGPITYLVTAYCQGISFAEWLKNQTVLLPPKEFIRLLLPLVEAVEFMHSHGVLHRDIKPGNILLDGTSSGESHVVPGVLKLTDFGLAVFADSDKHLTHTGTLIGTLAYMPPEQVDLRRSSIGPQLDVYSLGVVLYEGLTGKLPFSGSTDADFIRQLLTDDPLPPRKLRQEIPRDLEVICLKCLEKDPRKRYPKASLLADDLRSFLKGEPIQARPVSGLESFARWTTRNPALSTMSLATTLVALGLLVTAIRYTTALRKHSEDLDAARVRAEASERRLIVENYAGEIQFASSLQNGMSLGNLSSELDKLRPKPGHEDNRGFEWYYLKNVARQQRYLRGHRRPVYSVAMSPDGRLCASGSRDGMILVWNLAEGIPIAEWNLTAAVRNVEFSRDGQYLYAVACERDRKHSLAVWNVVSQREVARLANGPFREITHTFGSPNQDLVGFIGTRSGANEDLIGFWNWRSGELTDLPIPANTEVFSASFSPDGHSLMATFTLPPQVLVWDVPSQNLRTTLLGHERGVSNASWSHDGKLLATGSADETVRIWDLEQGAVRTIRSGLEGPVRCVAFQPTGQLLAVSTYESESNHGPEKLLLFDAIKGESHGIDYIPGSSIHEIAWAPDGKTLAVACEDHYLRLWKPLSESPATTLEVNGRKEAWGLAFSPDSETLAVGYDDEAGQDRETLKLWNVRTEREEHPLAGHQSMVTGFAFSPEGNRLYSVGYDHSLREWDLKTDTLTALIGQHDGGIKSVAITSDGRTIATCGKDQSLKLWDTATRQLRMTLRGRESSHHAVAFNPTGTILAASDDEFEISLWDVNTGNQIRSLTDVIPVVGLAFSPSGTYLATANQHGTVCLYETSHFNEPRKIIAHEGESRAVAFSPDGKTLATGGADGVVRLWHVATCREMLKFDRLSAPVNRVTFAPDGRHLAAALHNGKVHLWRAAQSDE